MVVTMTLMDGGNEMLGRAIDALRRRARKVEQLAIGEDERAQARSVVSALANEDAREDELDPLLIGTLAWQRRERYRAERDGRVYSIGYAIKLAYLRIEESKRSIRRMHSSEQDALGIQWHPTVVSIADMEAALTFTPNDLGHYKARWVYALVVGREPVVSFAEGRRIETYKEAVPRSTGQAASWLDISRRHADLGFGIAEAVLENFLCHEGLIE
jgi:hypothetical protein